MYLLTFEASVNDVYTMYSILVNDVRIFIFFFFVETNQHIIEPSAEKGRYTHEKRLDNM